MIEGENGEIDVSKLEDYSKKMVTGVFNKGKIVSQGGLNMLTQQYIERLKSSSQIQAINFASKEKDLMAYLESMKEENALLKQNIIKEEEENVSLRESYEELMSEFEKLSADQFVDFEAVVNSLAKGAVERRKKVYEREKIMLLEDLRWRIEKVSGYIDFHLIYNRWQIMKLVSKKSVGIQIFSLYHKIQET